MANDRFKKAQGKLKFWLFFLLINFNRIYNFFFSELTNGKIVFINKRFAESCFNGNGIKALLSLEFERQIKIRGMSLILTGVAIQ